MSRASDGYGTAHRAARERWRYLVERGQVACARCGKPILPGSRWHLDHADDRSGYLGPSHAACNLGAGAVKTNRARAAALRASAGAPSRARVSRGPVGVDRWSRCWCGTSHDPRCPDGRACRCDACAA
jgi:hypothetical protein